MSLAVLRASVSNARKEQEDATIRLKEACVPPPPELDEAKKWEWMNRVTEVLQTKAKKGDTNFTLRNFADGHSAFHHKWEDRDRPLLHGDLQQEWRVRDQVSGFDTMSYDGFMTDHPDALSVVGLFFWSVDSRINISRAPRDVRSLVLQRFQKFMSDIQSSLIEYWRLNSDIPVTSLTKEFWRANTPDKNFGLQFDWSESDSDSDSEPAEDRKRARAVSQHITKVNRDAKKARQIKVERGESGESGESGEYDEQISPSTQATYFQCLPYL